MVNPGTEHILAGTERAQRKTFVELTGFHVLRWAENFGRGNFFNTSWGALSFKLYELNVL